MRKFKFLTTLMSGLLLCLSMIMTSCSEPRRDYQVITQPGTGEQMVVVQDQNGNQMLMNYLVFRQLMSQPGGYSNVTHYYQANPSSVVPYQPSRYSNWQRSSWSSNNVSSGSRTTTTTTTTPSQTKSSWSSTNRTAPTTKSSWSSSSSSSKPATKSSWSSSSSSSSKSSSWGSRSSSRSHSHHH